MITFNFNIRNPWGNDFKNVRCWSGKTPFKNKFWEFEILKSSDIVTLLFEVTHRQDHAGVNFELALLGYGIHFMIYDNRHWDYVLDKWQVHTHEENLL